jgi:ATP-dependent Clp protease protease subunit
MTTAFAVGPVAPSLSINTGAIAAPALYRNVAPAPTSLASLSSLATASVACAVGLLGLRSSQAKRRSSRRWATIVAAQPTPEIDPRPPSEDKPKPLPPMVMPMISTAKGNIDVMSRLLQDRILILSGPVNDEMANVLIAQMLYLANQDAEKDITIYINSPGGSVSAGMAIYDSMQFVPCDVNTVCFGMAASMGAFLLGAGTKGKRKSLPNARVMIHQPLGGAGGQAADMEIQAKEILFLRDILNTYLADFTGKPLATIAEDCDRDYFMTPEEAVAYGIIDEVVKTKSWPRLQKPAKPDLFSK